MPAMMHTGMHTTRVRSFGYDPQQGGSTTREHDVTIELTIDVGRLVQKMASQALRSKNRKSTLADSIIVAHVINSKCIDLSAEA